MCVREEREGVPIICGSALDPIDEVEFFSPSLPLGRWGIRLSNPLGLH